MASFSRLFDPALVELVSSAIVRLDDPERVEPAPSPQVIVRPGVARLAGRRVAMAELRRVGGDPVEIVSPLRAIGRRVAISPLPDGAVELLELSPFPFNRRISIGRRVEEVLRRCARGLPTFYLSPSPLVAEDDEMVGQDDVLATLAADTDRWWFGILFQDGIPISPRAAIGLIADAMRDAGDADDAVDGWRELAGAVAATTSVRITGHTGHELEGSREFTIEVRPDADPANPIASGARQLGADEDLERALAADPLATPVGPLSSLLSPPADHHVAIRWTGDPPTDDEATPLLTCHETGVSAMGSDFVRLPVLAGDAHLSFQALDLSRWYPPVPAQPTRPAVYGAWPVLRMHRHCRVEPLVDGIVTFERLVQDLRAARNAAGWALFQGWTFNRFLLDPRFPRSDIVDLAEDILQSQGIVQLIATRFVVVDDPGLGTSRALALALLILLTDAILLAAFVVELVRRLRPFDPGLETDTPVVVGWFVLAGIATIFLALETTGTFAAEALLDLAVGLTQTATEVVTAMNAIAPTPTEQIAVFATNPATFSDNPLSAEFPEPFLGLDSDASKVNVFHNKVQLVRRTPDDRGDQHVAYLGGIDINRNRLDSPGHQLAGPYHDVHARITGPVAADAFNSFRERWIHDRALDGATGGPAIPEVAPGAMPTHPDAGHVARISRTFPGPIASGRLDFVPLGDRGIHDTLIASIRAARQFIYIEDQYFSPDDVYLDALRAAADQCQRLLVMVPSENDQPMGDLRRRFVIERLIGAWGTKMRIGYPERRPRLAKADMVSSKGRSWLTSACGPGDATIFLSPPSRVLEAPFWLWIDGELMLATSVVKNVMQEGVPAARVTVERGAGPAGPRWDAHPRGHLKGAPATFSQVAHILVHAKCMMIDDVFVSIGSANVNRRGFFSDGEINVFAIPEQLHGAPENPARALRTALWAEHLGIPPALGPSLLRDPIAAFDLFLRPRCAGGRFSSLDATNIKPWMSVTDAQLFPMSVLGLVQVLATNIPAASLTALYRQFWNLGSDATTGVDPDPTLGPVPP